MSHFLPIEKKLIVWCLVLGCHSPRPAPLGQRDLLSGGRPCDQGLKGTIPLECCKVCGA